MKINNLQDIEQIKLEFKTSQELYKFLVDNGLNMVTMQNNNLVDIKEFKLSKNCEHDYKVKIDDIIYTVEIFTNNFLMVTNLTKY